MLTPFPLLQTLVVPPPHHPAPRIPQGSTGGLQTRNHGPERNCEPLNSQLLQSHQSRKEQALVLLPTRSYPPKPVDGKEVCLRPGSPRFPSLPGAEIPQQMTEALPGHFFLPRAAFSPHPRLRPHNSTPPLTKDEIANALSKFFSSSAPGPDGIPYLTWKRVKRSTLQSFSKCSPRWFLICTGQF